MNTPSRSMEVGMAFWPAKVLLSALELQLFTVLGAALWYRTGSGSDRPKTQR
ncbi:MAG TPA: hypothetical protein VK208_18560 [Pyrinomonadaceae bacterium]|nr:hypothetical protein [Pyrinomonadaceae bacterium]